jgi:hypothetical protein
MMVITETNLLTLSVPDDGYSRNQSFDFELTIIRYAQSQKIGFWNNHHQVRSKSKDWFLE